jgi:lysyl-tRNA synthetase, class II
VSDEPPVEGWPAESAQRLEKAEALRKRGINPYPNRFERTDSLAALNAAHGGQSLDDLEALGKDVRIAGRVMTLRGQGKVTFATLSDGEARLQIYVRQDDVGEENYRLLDLVDRGDYIGVAGRVMRTRKGELSVQAKELTFLSKALLPPPEKWHGLADVEARYRQRYVDLMASPEVRKTFVDRSAMISEMRRFLDERGYVEVETPMMQPVPGGALARPFKTRHNALDIDLYLRIAPELYLKRLVVGGLEKVYEINRNFRNEGISSMHNPEFTMLEFYTAYFNCQDVMAITEELIARAAARVLQGKTASYLDKTTGQRRDVDFSLPFRRVTMKDAIAEVADREGWGLTRSDLDDPAAVLNWVTGQRTRAQLSETRRSQFDLGMSPKAFGVIPPEMRVPHLFDALVQAMVWDPTFIVDYPVEVSPLAKKKDDQHVADRFELFMAGMEVANGFSELNDPLEQRDRFFDQLKRREKGDLEAHVMDDDYIRALGHGLPPTGGCGVGIDRLAMVLTDSPSIRDVILFPHMRPEGGRR